MINKLELKKLPFVDTCPEPDQKRIQWVRNGECPAGATTKYGNDGNLNAAGVGIFHDVLQLEENANTTKESMNLVIDNVNNINKALEMGSDVDVIKQIAENKENIEILQVHMQFAEENIGELETATEFLKEDVGVYDPAKDPVMRPVRGDIVFIKNEMGNYPDQDMNGNSAPGAEAHGMKRRIIDTASALVTTISRVKKLEDDYQDSDVGSLSIKINEIRDEMGPKTEATGTPIYGRVKSLETLTDQSDQTITEIKNAIGLGAGPSINVRVQAIDGRLKIVEDGINTPITGILARVNANETAIGTSAQPASINGRLATLRTDHDALSVVVGTDSSSGLRGTVAWQSQIIGTEVSPAQGTIQFRLKAVETKTTSSEGKIQDLQTEIGTNTSGLKGTVLKHTKQIDGTNPNGTTVEQRGLIRSVENLESRTANNINDAPADGKEYVRKDNAWAVASAFEAASDVAQIKLDIVDIDGRVDVLETKAVDNANSIGNNTARIVSLEDKLPNISNLEADVAQLKLDVAQLKIDVAAKTDEAPEDGEAYVRVNKTWVLLSSFLPTP